MEHNITGLSVNMFVSNSEKALEYYTSVFGAKIITARLGGECGENNGLFTIGDYKFAVADENIQYGSKSPTTLGGVTVCIQLFVRDIKAVLSKALEKGGEIVAPSTKDTPIVEMDGGVQFCNIVDPFGHVWSITKA